MADPDPMTCDPGSRVYDPNPGAVIPDPIYLVMTLRFFGADFFVVDGAESVSALFKAAFASFILFASGKM